MVEPPANAYSIGQLSRLTGVKIPTIRFYEKAGLLDAPVRSSGNQRRYDAAGLERLRFVAHARQLGLSLDMVRQLLTISGQHGYSCERVHQIAGEHLLEVRRRIEQLRRLEAELCRVESSCGKGDVDACLVLATINDHSRCIDADHGVLQSEMPPG